MKAIILAAGKGERLKGIVDAVPKPMVRIAGKPILRHNIELCRKYGITDLYVNLHHLPDRIVDYFGNGKKFGVTITYSYEETLLGTAGAVRRIADHFWKEDRPPSAVRRPGSEVVSTPDVSTYSLPFLVIYGDNLLNYDLKTIIGFHQARKGMGTIAFHRKDDVSQSGIALLDDDGRIVKFIEKPGPHECISNLVNAGLYVLDLDILKYILPGRVIDFARNVFPYALRNGEALYGIEAQGSLIAIDTPDLFKAAGPAL
jgi:mannose-1-phosphate guanylyltransferase/phosphomannomutase